MGGSLLSLGGLSVHLGRLGSLGRGRGLDGRSLDHGGFPGRDHLDGRGGNVLSLERLHVIVVRISHGSVRVTEDCGGGGYARDGVGVGLMLLGLHVGGGIVGRLVRGGDDAGRTAGLGDATHAATGLWMKR